MREIDEEIEVERDGTGPAQRQANPSTAAFVAHRNLLFTVAYEMLGSAADAEDVVQETWLRWMNVPIETVQNVRAYLVRITTHQALNRLRTLSRRKESYMGPWLPEPLLTSPDVAEQVELVDNLSTAMLLLLETLTPMERAVFVLRDVFAFGYDEIADAVGKSTDAVRQIARRARTHVAARRPRRVASSAEVQAALRLFRTATQTGELQDLIGMLAPDVEIVTDGGGIRTALVRTVSGVEKVAGLFRVAMNKVGGAMSFEEVHVNGSPALLLRLSGELHGVLTVRVEDGLVKSIYLVVNPEKLTYAARETALQP